MSLIVPTRRRFLTGLAALIAAPAIVRATSLMPVKALIAEINFTALDGIKPVMFMYNGSTWLIGDGPHVFKWSSDQPIDEWQVDDVRLRLPANALPGTLLRIDPSPDRPTVTLTG